MYVVMVASEFAPVAKVGGLGDVIHGLSGEISKHGHTVEIILPKYDCMRRGRIDDLRVDYQDLWVPWAGGQVHCSVFFGFVEGRRCYFIDPHSPDNFFSRGAYYGFNDEDVRYAFFCKAAMEFLLKSDKRPDVIHCHDWQTALIPPLLFEMYKYAGMGHCRACFTVHNFKHQGVCNGRILSLTGLNRHDYYYARDRMGDDFNPAALNLMKGGIVFSNFVTTVSPRHAWEALNTDQSFGLGHTLNSHRGKFGGVLNGVDHDVWNPETDRSIPCRYSADDFDTKYENKTALRRRLMLADEFKPIVAYIGRLDTQKGVHLIRHALYFSIWNNAQFVLLGAGAETAINEHFLQLKRHLNDSPDCHLEIGFDEDLAHLIYAGADLFVQPSLFEPCGLTQMIAMRYGTVPVVHGVGGLADTVFDWNHADRPLNERNGYVFHEADYPGLESALSRAFGLWHHHPDQFRAMALNGMRFDTSWRKPAEHYENIYEFIRDK